MAWIRFDGKSERGVHHCWMEFPHDDNESLIQARHVPEDKINWTAAATGDKIKIVGIHIAYKIVGGTYYDSRTDDAVIRALENARQRGRRIKIHLGDTETGKDWHEEYMCRGYIGRSTGRVKAPLMIANKRSTGGPHILDHCIVRIRETGKDGRVLYQHPNYTPQKFEIAPNTHPEWKKDLPVSVLADGQNVANFKDEKSAQRYIDNVTGAV